MSSNKSLFRNGRISALLDQMESDALAGASETEEALRRYWSNKDRPWKSLEETRITEDIQIFVDAYRICRDVRKYVPFIEAGVMTLSEAITIESQKPKEKKS